jgi:hypothetical protein
VKRVLVETEGGEGVVVGCAHHTQCTCCKSMMRCFYFELVILFFGLVFQLVVSLRMVRVGMKIPQDGNRAKVYRYVYMVRGYVWRTLCSVCATGARVAQPSLCNS